MKVVFDSNILISALVFSGKQAEKALLRVIAGRDQLILSNAIVDEVLEVLARKFARDAEELARIAVLLADLANIVQSPVRIRALQDESDNRILECAISAGVHLIVTGDQEMLKLGQFKGVRLISLRNYLES